MIIFWQRQPRGDNYDDVEIGRLWIEDGHIHARGDAFVLSVASRPLKLTFGGEVDPATDPEKFLYELPSRYHGTYLWAGEVPDEDPGAPGAQAEENPETTNGPERGAAELGPLFDGDEELLDRLAEEADARGETWGGSEFDPHNWTPPDSEYMRSFNTGHGSDQPLRYKGGSRCRYSMTIVTIVRTTLASTSCRSRIGVSLPRPSSCWGRSRGFPQ